MTETVGRSAPTTAPVTRARRRAAFLDRDGVLVRDVDTIVAASDFEIVPGAPEALRRLRTAGFQLILITNQAVVARGMATLDEVVALNAALSRALARMGGAALDGSYVCPHHPEASLAAFRADCPCRKPRPGMLLRAAGERGIDLAASYMIGDRITDVAAGAGAGCRTVLVETGRHLDPPIVSPMRVDPRLTPDRRCSGLLEAADWILGEGE